MKDSIYTIPISEVFEPRHGCPLCALHSSLEERWVDYITGAAMMESDVRIETNIHGFCQRHYDMTLSRRNRLSVALMLQSRLEHLDKELETTLQKQRGTEQGKGIGRFFLKRHRSLLHGDVSGAAHGQALRGCFVCMKINGESFRIASNIASVWEKQPDFRTLYSEQELICYTHAELLLSAAEQELHGENLSVFTSNTISLTRNGLQAAKRGIDSFCNLFDYRNAHGPQPPLETARAVESAIEYLNGIKIE